MHKVTELALKTIHPKWLTLFNTPMRSGEMLIDVFDTTITTIVGLGVKLCPDTPNKILRCLRLDPDLIKVVIVGQDPYPQPGVATGLAFACNDKFQPSLQIILRELQKETQDEIEVFNGTLEHWEQQGVLLLNSSLSCEEWKAGSHNKIWEEFIEGLLGILNDFKITRKEMTSLVFVFLGKQAQLFEAEISDKLHFKILRNHPAAETYGGNKFIGFFKEVNKYLEESGQEQINWI